MTIDKSWTTLSNRNSPPFLHGLVKFLEHCETLLDSNGEIACPCVSCGNSLTGSKQTLWTHISEYGFDSTYTTWDKHGEPHPPPPPPVVDNTPHPHSPEYTEMAAFLNDIRENNQPAPPTQTTNPQPTQTTGRDRVKEFEKLFGRATDKLFPDCDWMTSLDFMSKMSHAKVLGKTTDSGFNLILDVLQQAFPPSKGFKLPPSYYEMKKTFKTIGLGYESIHACINDCCLFWGKSNINEDNCPICGASRWKDLKTKGKKVANKVVRYFPITPRLERMYSSEHTAKDMTWHATGKSKDGKMYHPVDGTEWKNFDMMHPTFAKEPRNVRLGLAADGFNPFGMLSQNYSMWPVILTTYNTPPWVCMKETSFMLTMLIPGPKTVGKDIDVYLQPLVAELKTLWKDGVWTKDNATGTHFTMKAALLWTINDFPARSSLSGWTGQGYFACPTCNKDTPVIRVRGKQAYVGHRKWLLVNHKWRKKHHASKFNGKVEKGRAPSFTKADIEEQLNRLPIRIPGKHSSNKNKKPNRKVELNWSKKSIFYELEYWHTLDLRHNLDVMHIEKNVLECMMGTMLMNDYSKDTIKARQDLEDMGIRPELWLIDNKNGKFLKPHPKYSFKPKDREKFCQYIKGVKLPDGFGSYWKHKVNDDNSNITNMKSHDCHIMMQRLLPYGVQQYLPKEVATPIIQLCYFFKQICANVLTVRDMVKAKVQIINILCSLEQVFPPAFFTIMVHLVIHLPEEAIKGGPQWCRWMYPFERYMKKLKNYVRNKAKPEGSIAEAYIAEEALTYCSHYMKGVETRFNRLDRNEDDVDVTNNFQVFRSVCRPLGKEVYTSLNTDVMQKVTWYVLNNSPEMDADIVAYKNAFPSNNVEKEFPCWINDEIRRKRVNKDPSCIPELFSLACGPSSSAVLYTACQVNGVRFMVHERDIHRTTQNSGVSTAGPNGETYYGQLEQILELTYIGRNKVVLFGCKWFDTSNVKRFYTKDNIKHINTSNASTALYRNQPYILATQARQVFYLDDPARRPLHWKVVEDVNHLKSWRRDSVVVVDDEDVIHDNTSSDVELSADLDELDFANMSMNDESTEVDAPVDDDNNDDDLNIIYDEDDVAIDIGDDEEDVDLASDDEVEPVRVYSSSDED